MINLLRDLFISIKDKRRRLKRPLVISLIGLGFILAPIFNIIWAMLESDLPFGRIFTSYDLLGLVLLFIAPLIGLGILLVERWGWYNFIGFALAVMIYDSIILIRNSNTFNMQTLIVSAILLALVGLFFT